MPAPNPADAAGIGYLVRSVPAKSVGRFSFLFVFNDDVVDGRLIAKLGPRGPDRISFFVTGLSNRVQVTVMMRTAASWQPRSIGFSRLLIGRFPLGNDPMQISGPNS